jgi:hypothetical protein
VDTGVAGGLEAERGIVLQRGRQVLYREDRAEPAELVAHTATVNIRHPDGQELCCCAQAVASGVCYAEGCGQAWSSVLVTWRISISLAPVSVNDG